MTRYFINGMAPWLRACLFVFALLVAGAPAAHALEGTEPLEITTARGPLKMQVEVMRTETERARGLMFRRYMPEDRGMLFEFGRDELIQMWMKNTYLPLDMIFIARNGAVTAIARDAEPLSERIISSGGPAFSVLEVNAGFAAKNGIAVGDMIRHPLFGKR